MNYNELSHSIKQWASDLGFNHCGIADTELEVHERHLMNWLDDGFHADMDYMEKHGVRRSRPELLHEGTVRVISVRMNYLPEYAASAETVLNQPEIGYVSRYALGRDYHKLMRKKLQTLASQIEHEIGPFGYRAFVDSAPVLEKALAEKAGLGWIGKHSNLLTREGSWFFLGELYTDLPLPVDSPLPSTHCGSCTACIDHCPTGAIIAPYRVDARLCVSYHTIENRGTVPTRLRKLIGNRIYGCDDCQLYCPWNRFSETTEQSDFEPRHALDTTGLIELFAWTENEFLTRTEGSAIRRIGHDCWLRNIAIALGNTASSPAVIDALQSRLDHPSEMVREHTQWAIEQHQP